MSNKYKLLIIEDEESILKFTTALFEANNYKVITAKTVKEALFVFSSYNPDVIILDLGLPDEDGMVFLEKIRGEFNTPVIVLSARNNEQDKVLAFDKGANDYVTKPFGSMELLARIKNVLRNTRQNFGGGRVKIDNAVIDYDTRKFYFEGNEIKLTQTEFNILAYMAEHFGKVLTYSMIIKEIWGYSDSGSVKKLQVNIANIRRKLNINPGDDRFISNELGVGYRMHSDG